MKDLTIIQLELGQLSNYDYIVADKKTSEAMIIDPCEETGPLIKTLKKENFKLIGILLTHGHYDHVDGADSLAVEFNVPVYLSEHEASFYIPKCRNLKTVKDGEIIKLGELPIKVLHTPGHTPGCQCFYIEGNLFTGDTLFIDAVGRTDFPGGSTRTLYQSLQLIKKFPDETIIWPGHNYGAVSHEKLSVLKKKNSFLRAQGENEFS